MDRRYLMINIILFALLLFASISSISAVSYSVDSSCDSDYIQNLINNDSLNITELHFSNVSGSVFDGIVLDIYKSIVFTCDDGVVLKGKCSFAYAFNVLSDDVTVVGFNFVDYFMGVIADNVNNLSIVNNTFNVSIDGVVIGYSRSVNILDNVFNGGYNSNYGVNVNRCEYVNIVGNYLNNTTLSVYVSESNNINVSDNNLINTSVYGVGFQRVNNSIISNNSLENDSNYCISINHGDNVTIEGNSIKKIVSLMDFMFILLIILRLKTIL